jgi:3-deoxy-D-manno-octulosonate 8-phosphate phosphatase (KDO 8-P phosphatase)
LIARSGGTNLEPGAWNLELFDRARKVRLVAMDVDGVLTDAGMYYGENGEELKKFNTRDGMGVALVREAGLKTAILTRESTKIVERRGAKMRIDHVFIGVTDKLDCMRGLLSELGLTLGQVAYIGDDVNDYELLGQVGLAVAVRDASRLPKSVAHYVTEAKGGEGAVRELCELILEAQREHPPLPEA